MEEIFKWKLFLIIFIYTLIVESFSKAFNLGY